MLILAAAGALVGLRVLAECDLGQDLLGRDARLLGCQDGGRPKPTVDGYDRRAGIARPMSGEPRRAAPRASDNRSREANRRNG
jgi:hypothetical protein